jgi:hypothetical protein
VAPSAPIVAACDRTGFSALSTLPQQGLTIDDPYFLLQAEQPKHEPLSLRQYFAKQSQY